MAQTAAVGAEFQAAGHRRPEPPIDKNQLISFQPEGGFCELVAPTRTGDVVADLYPRGSGSIDPDLDVVVASVAVEGFENPCPLHVALGQGRCGSLGRGSGSARGAGLTGFGRRSGRPSAPRQHHCHSQNQQLLHALLIIRPISAHARDWTPSTLRPSTEARRPGSRLKRDPSTSETTGRSAASPSRRPFATWHGTVQHPITEGSFKGHIDRSPDIVRMAGSISRDRAVVDDRRDLDLGIGLRHVYPIEVVAVATSSSRQWCISSTLTRLEGDSARTTKTPVTPSKWRRRAPFMTPIIVTATPTDATYTVVDGEVTQ